MATACSHHGAKFFSNHVQQGSATARTLSAQENLGGLYRGRYRLTQRHERRDRRAGHGAWA